MERRDGSRYGSTVAGGGVTGAGSCPDREGREEGEGGGGGGREEGTEGGRERGKEGGKEGRVRSLEGEGRYMGGKGR